MKTDRRQLWLGLALAIAAIVLMEMRCNGQLFNVEPMSRQGYSYAGVVTESFISRVAWRESRNNPQARGVAGERGIWQMKPVAVKDVQARYGWRHTFQQATTTHARAYAEAYLIMCEVRFRNHYKRNPSEVELYRVWNRGFAGSLKGGR